MRIPNYLAMAAIRIYQLTMAPWLHRRGLRCRHHPTCSQYGIIAYAKHGFFRATALTWKRYQSCRPGSSRPTIDFP